MKKFIITNKYTLIKTLDSLNKTEYKCLLVVDKNNKFLGTISDGDIRKAILNGINLKDTIDSIYNKKSYFFKKNEYNTEQINKGFYKYHLTLIPVIDKKLKIVEIIFWDKILKKKKINNKINIPVLIMAGGKGARLEPFTEVLPKPLIPINGKPIIEHIIDNFLKYKINKYFLSINYKSKILKSFFQEKKQKNINFIEEKKPLGTAGSLSLIKNKINGPIIVTNCDILVDIDFYDFYKFHQKNKNDISILTVKQKYTIPYGIFNQSKTGKFLGIEEKLNYNFMINAGMYILNPNILKLIPKNKFYHMTNLINDANKNNFKVGLYPINKKNWLDIGQWKEYRNALKKL